MYTMVIVEKNQFYLGHTKSLIEVMKRRFSLLSSEKRKKDHRGDDGRPFVQLLDSPLPFSSHT